MRPEYLENNIAGTMATNHPLYSQKLEVGTEWYTNGRYQSIILHSFLVLETEHWFILLLSYDTGSHTAQALVVFHVATVNFLQYM